MASEAQEKGPEAVLSARARREGSIGFAPPPPPPPWICVQQATRDVPSSCARVQDRARVVRQHPRSIAFCVRGGRRGVGQAGVKAPIRSYRIIQCGADACVCVPVSTYTWALSGLWRPLAGAALEAPLGRPSRWPGSSDQPSQKAATVGKHNNSTTRDGAKRSVAEELNTTQLRISHADSSLAVGCARQEAALTHPLSTQRARNKHWERGGGPRRG